MEMDNPVLMQILNVQSQMLQQMQAMQMQSTLTQNQPNTNLAQTTMTPTSTQPMSTQPMAAMASQPNIYDGNQYYPPLQTEAPQVMDPTKYSTYSTTGNAGQVGTLKRSITDAGQGLIGQTIANVRGFDPTRQSKESAQEYFSMQTRGMQEAAAGITGGAVQGAMTAGSFFIPSLVGGLGVGLAVTGVASSVSNGATAALDYQDILRKQGYKAFNAFESSTEFGGIGLKLDDRQELSGFLRDLAPEKFLDDQEMQKILSGSLEHKLMKSSTDVESFKKKFTQIVDTVKQITITMDQSIEEATKFMGELERRGIASKDMSFIAGQTKVVSSMLGIDASKGAEILLGNTDRIVAGTSMSAKNVMDSTGTMMFMGSMIEQEAKNAGDPLYNYMKNNGGAGQISANMEAQMRGFSSTEQGRNYLLGFFGSMFEKNGDNFTVNHDTMNDLMSGRYSVRDLERMSQESMRGLNETDKAKLAGSVSSVWNNAAGTTEYMKFLEQTQKIFEEQAGAPMDPQTALVQMGIAADYEQANLLNRFLEKAGDPNIGDRLAARSFKEEMDSAALGNTPTLYQRAKFWMRRNITNEFGDMGQGIADYIGDVSSDYQKLITGIDDRGVVGGALLSEYNIKGANKVFDDAKKINDTLKASAEGVRDQVGSGNYTGMQDMITMSAGLMKTGSAFEKAGSTLGEGSFKLMIEQIEHDQLSASDLRRLKERLDNGDFDHDVSSKQRAQYLVNKATGQYDGMGNFIQAVDRMNVGLLGLTDGTEWMGSMDGFKKKAKEVFSGGPTSTLEALKANENVMRRESKDLRDKVVELFSGKENLGVSAEQYDMLEGYIQLGRVEDVSRLTSNQKAIELAKKYQSSLEKQQDHQESMRSFTDMTRYTEGTARLGTQLSDLVAASGAYSKEEAQLLFGKYREQGKNTLELLEDGKLDPQEMKERSLAMIEGGENIFRGMSQFDLEKIARYVADKSSSDSITMESLFAEGGEGFVDTQKLYDAVTNNILRKYNSDDKDDKVKPEGDDSDVKKTADGHKKAMYELLDVLKEEMKAINNTKDDIKYGSYSSLGSR